MAISLSKGGNVSLSKAAPGLTKLHVGLGWDIRSTDGAAFDLDAVLFAVKGDGKVRSDADFVYYNQKSWEGGVIEHAGDNTLGDAAGDDEVMILQLDKIPADIDKAVIGVTIHEAETRKQNFGMVSKAFVRVVNQADNVEIARYDLSEDASTETAMIFGEVYRSGAEWKFRAVGQGFQGGLGPLAKSFGVNV
ncbi:MAG: TerD family protein [Verrucomicrobiota bacterium]